MSFTVHTPKTRFRLIEFGLSEVHASMSKVHTAHNSPNFRKFVLDRSWREGEVRVPHTF